MIVLFFCLKLLKLALFVTYVVFPVSDFKCHPTYYWEIYIYLESYLKLFKTILNHLQIEAPRSEYKFIIYSQSESQSTFILSFFDKSAVPHRPHDKVFQASSIPINDEDVTAFPAPAD